MTTPHLDPAMHRRINLSFTRKLLLVLSILLVLVGLEAQRNQTAALGEAARCDPDGGAVAALGGVRPSDMTLELAGSGTLVLGHLWLDDAQRVNDFEQRICAEARARRYENSIGRIDNTHFMPLYSLMGLALAAYLVLVRNETRCRVAAGALIVMTMVLVLLDSWENRRTLQLLAQAIDPQVIAMPQLLDEAAGRVREASLMKWLATGVWALTLSIAFWWSAGPVRSIKCMHLAAVPSFIGGIVTLVGCALAFVGQPPFNRIGDEINWITYGFMIVLAALVPMATALVLEEFRAKPET